MVSALRHRLPRIGRLPRLCAIGICLLLALNSALESAPAASAGRSVPVLVAARDLPAGHTVAARDVRVARWPAGLRPASARAAPATVIGRRLVAPISAREPLTATRLLGPGLTAGLPAGLLATPVTVNIPHVADLVHAGNHVDLLATPRPLDDVGTASAGVPMVATIARGALVLAAFAGSDDVSGEVVLALDRAAVVTVVRDIPTQVFTVVTAPP